MITDSQTNFLYLADTLPCKYPSFYKSLQEVLKERDIPSSLLPHTKDVWAVDYMPIQVTETKFVKFVYNPDYLRDTIKWRKTISDTNAICTGFNLPTVNSDILIDGGNVIKGANKVIMCEKVFRENPHYTEKHLISELERLFEVDGIIFIPTDPSDDIGHADGMVRFLDDNTVLINDYSKEDIDFQLQFRHAFHNAGLNYIEVPYHPYGNMNDLQANGIYINYLQMKQAVVVPIFGIAEDEKAVRQFEELFRGQTLTTIDCNDIANEGGVLNCVSWNILKLNSC
jgi:agmatine deiminase